MVRLLLGESPLGRIYLIREGGEVAGYVALRFGYSIEFTGRDAFVDEFFIAEAHRGRRLGVRTLHLEVARDNGRARGLYESSGFALREGFHLMSRRL